MRVILFFLLLGDAFASISLETNVSDLLSQLGDARPEHYIKELQAKRIKQGEELVNLGSTTDDNGVQTRRISEKFKCIDCHNTKKEDYSLSSPNPADRIKYVAEKSLPLLPGTTLYGVVNKIEYYNGVYREKYGTLISDSGADEDLYAAVEVCAAYCSKGRDLEDWETDAIISYLWSLQYRLSDLGYTAESLQSLNTQIDDPAVPRKEIIAEIKSKYLSKNVAEKNTKEETIKYLDTTTDVANTSAGKVVFEQSCLHCHGNRPGAPKENSFKPSKQFFKMIYERAVKTKRWVHPIRLGIDKPQTTDLYMPYYTNQRLSDKNILDLFGFIKEQAQ